MTKPVISDRGSATEAEWTRTRDRVAETVGALEAGFFLELETRDDVPYFVRVLATGGEGFRVDVVADSALPEWRHVGEWGAERLQALGWNAPGGDGPDASPTWWRQFAAAEVADLAGALVAIVREVFEVAHPHALVYVASDSAGDVVVLPGLGLARRPGLAPLDQRVGEALQRILATAEVPRDAEGDWPLTVGEGVVYVRALERDGVVAVFGPALLGLPSTPQLLAAVNDLNAKIHGARAWFTGDAIAVASEFVDSADLEGLRPAIETVAALVHAIGQDFRATFGGHLVGEPDAAPPPATATPEPETGMYL